jgi:hypothetical protein
MPIPRRQLAVPKAPIRTFRPAERSTTWDEVCVAQRHLPWHRASRAAAHRRRPTDHRSSRRSPVHRSLLPASLSLGRVAGQRRSKSTGAPGDLYVYCGRTAGHLTLPLAPHAVARSHHPLRTGPTARRALPLGDLIQGQAKHGGQTGAAKPSADSDHAVPLEQRAPHNDWVSIRLSAGSRR